MSFERMSYSPASWSLLGNQAMHRNAFPYRVHIKSKEQGAWSTEKSSFSEGVSDFILVRLMRTVRNVFFFAMLWASLCSSQASLPQVKVKYDAAEDVTCSQLPGGSIKQEWKAELLAREPEFIRMWEAEGPRLLAATESISGKDFPSHEITARLTLCNLPSESFPENGRVTINMRYALRSFTPEAVSIRYKVNTLFHELLHIFLERHPIANSVLLKEHTTENERVRDHLHLLALQKAVLLNLNQPDALKEVIDVDSMLPGGYYKRAWELVNATDTEYLKYVAELSR
jgi:hypothetical protein